MARTCRGSPPGRLSDAGSTLSGEERLPLLRPEEVEGLGLPLLALVDPPQAQDVERDGQEHHQDADGEQVVVVDEGGAQPTGVVLAEGFLLQVPGESTWETKRHINISPPVKKTKTIAAFRTRGACPLFDTYIHQLVPTSYESL